MMRINLVRSTATTSSASSYATTGLSTIGNVSGQLANIGKTLFLGEYRALLAGSRHPLKLPASPSHPNPNVRKIYGLRNQLLTQPVLLNGMNEEAAKQNARLMRALKVAGEIINAEMPNSIFGLMIQGSRVKGYHTVNSDLDLVFVCPDLEIRSFKQNLSDIHSIVDDSLQDHHLEAISYDGGAQLWQEAIILDGFVDQFDHHPLFLNNLFGHTIASNPNLLLARLAAIECVLAYGNDYNYDLVRRMYERYYLGERERDISKIAERLGPAGNMVSAILAPEVYMQRYQSFTLPEPHVIHKTLHRKLKAVGKAELRKYVMYDVYQQVQAELRAGW